MAAGSSSGRATSQRRARRSSTRRRDVVKAVVFEQFGPPEVLQLRDMPDPVRGAGEVVVRVRACSVNRTLDIETREKGAGFGVTLPHISGADPCGEVVAVGTGVTSPHVGQRVAVSPMLTCGACPMCRRGTENACLNLKLVGVHRHGGYAELVRAPAGNALPLPDGLSYEEAACLPLSYAVAWHLLVVLARAAPGDVVLIMAARRGLGGGRVPVAEAPRRRRLAG